MLYFATSPKLFILLFMAANKFGRYIWLVDLIRCHPYITFNEISERWETCGLGDGKPLPWKTFMNHKKAVQTIFNILISCDASRGYGYYIEDADSLEGDSFRSWLIDSYATLTVSWRNASHSRRFLRAINICRLSFRPCVRIVW